ncbi:MAG TPA: DUF72 domain-containing protein [Dehalococcoidia bacterium]|nr:DUF72 domain-containing protein [Dehalococcoidia bacterium]
MENIRIGTCSWTDPTLIKSGTFYPADTTTAEARLAYYASQFNVVEVDSSYYAMPDRQTATLWAQRTPDGFLFDIKAFRLFTQHPTEAHALPRDLRGALPKEIGKKQRFYYRDIPPEILRHLWARFEDVLLPLESAGKLGVVLFQFPEWFLPGVRQMDHILTCKEQLKTHALAVEFRNGLWLSDRNRDTTMSFLRDNGLAFVCVDGPQGFDSSIPPIAEVTADIAVVRFHGRNATAWRAKRNKAVDRFNYYYSQEELEPWAKKIATCAEAARQVHVLFNTNNGDQGVVNARLMARLL